MVYHVYMLACYIDGAFSCYYPGQTNDIKSRMQEHYDNVRYHDTNKFTGRFDFVKLIWKKQVATRGDALRVERYLKGLTPPEKRRYMKNK